MFDKVNNVINFVLLKLQMVNKIIGQRLQTLNIDIWNISPRDN